MFLRRVLIIGAGGIGSHLIPILSRIGLYELTVYDADIVEEKNLTYQNFYAQEIGQHKVKALCRTVFSTNYIPECYRILTKDQLQGYDLVVSCVDNLVARRLLYAHDKPWLDLRAQGRNCALISYQTPSEMYDELLSGPDGDFSCQGEEWDGEATGVDCMHTVVAGLGAQWIQRWFAKDHVEDNKVMNF